MLKKTKISILCGLTVLFIWSCSKSTDELIQDLRNDSARVRTAAGVALMKKQGDHETVQKLIGLLDDEDKRVAFIALQILGSLADTSAVLPLGKKINDPNPGVRARACYSLGSIGHESALPYLVSALEDSAAEVRHEHGHCEYGRWVYRLYLPSVSKGDTE